MEKFKEVLTRVRMLNQSSPDLVDQQSQLLDPVLKQVMQDQNFAEAEYLVGQLPSGFHRSELRVWFIRQKDLL